MLSLQHSTSIANRISQQLGWPAVGLCKTGLVNTQTFIKWGLKGPHTALLNSWLLMDSGRRTVIVIIAYKIVRLADSSGYFQTHGHTEVSVKIGGS